MKLQDNAPVDDQDAQSERIHVGVAAYAVSTDGSPLRTSGLGSCVGVGLYDPDGTVAGLAHPMLPEAEEPVEDVAKYADTGIEALLAEMEAAGANSASLEAKLAGGSSMLGATSSGFDVGQRNVEAARATLDQAGIPVVAADVGDSHGRSIELDPTTGDLRVRAATGDEQTL